MNKKIALVALIAAAVGAQAADWSDTYISFAHGNKFAEPYGSDKIAKNIYSLTHVSGYKYGTNFFNLDMLDSAASDPAYNGATKTGAQEVYVIYRNTLDLSKVTGKSYTAPGVKGFGLTGGFDFNSKNDAGYNSKKQMVVLGPTAFINVPAGFLNVSLLQLWESNAPSGWDYLAGAYYGTERYHYKPHSSLSASWGIPVAMGVPLEFEGVASYTNKKGKDEFGGDTAAETFIDLKLMYDVSSSVGAAPKTFKVGAEYQYWKNKFGNPTTATVISGSQAGPGATAKTPMIRAEYHF
jgi:hypothetical protein